MGDWNRSQPQSRYHALLRASLISSLVKTQTSLTDHKMISSSLKRKRTVTHEAAPESPPSEHNQSTVTRRATRQSSSRAPLVYQADPEPRRRRRTRADIPTSDEQSDSHDEDDDKPALLSNTTGKALRSHGRRTAVLTPPAPGRARQRGRPSTQYMQRRPVLRSAIQADSALNHLKPDLRNRTLRHHPQHNGAGHDNPRHGDSKRLVVAPMSVEVSTNRRPVGSAVGPIVGGSQSPSKSLDKEPPRRTSITATVPIMTQGQPRSSRVSDHIAANTSKPFVPSTTSPTKQQPKPARKQQPAKYNQEYKKLTSADRNIDKVVFGNVCFSTWYHSPYGTEALGEISGNSLKTATTNGVQDTSSKEESPLSLASKKTKDDRLDRLYVCPCCFKYSKELVPWWQHVHFCESRGYIPGEKIYTHPKGRPTRQAADGPVPISKGSGRKRKHSDVPVDTNETAAEDHGEWSIWQVDGEKDVLFCQNLSLFAKLFLDNKSVFFDVNGFHYFLLVHTAPRPPSDGVGNEVLPPKHQIVGFFSKEKLSWDNNNLACILVFPPWQRKGLGALLMGVSYEISKREGMLGGPEKPISDLGKKGYKRFWAGEIASWILGLDTSGKEEVIVDVDDCSKATWIVPEDCLMILKEMGIVEEAGMGPPKPKRREVVSSTDEDESGEETVAAAESVKENEVKEEVPRVRVSKDNVRKWVEANKISLEKACDSDGFVEGYAVKQTVMTDEEEV